MKDTSPEFEDRVAAHYAALSPLERLRIASGLYDSARLIIASSLPPDLPDEERRYAIMKRLYGDELPEAALRAHARHVDLTER
jgi:hypothetical protein